MGLRGPQVGHRGTPEERLRARLSIGGLDACWEWQGGRQNGYGALWVDGRTQYTHRLAWTFWRGPIPETLTLDHLCRNRACANPRHLEPVPLRENILRGVSPSAEHARATHCIHGHEFTEENTAWSPDGHRSCRECHRAKGKRYRERKHGRRRSLPLSAQWERLDEEDEE